jgi:4-coumarate--CoA ligase
MLTHSNISTNFMQLTQPGYMITKKFMGGNEQERLIGILPFSHIYGLVLVLANIYIGGSTMTLPRFEPFTFLDAMRRHRVRIIN